MASRKSITELQKNKKEKRNRRGNVDSRLKTRISKLNNPIVKIFHASRSWPNYTRTMSRMKIIVTRGNVIVNVTVNRYHEDLASRVHSSYRVYAFQLHIMLPLPHDTPTRIRSITSNMTTYNSCQPFLPFLRYLLQNFRESFSLKNRQKRLLIKRYRQCHDVYDGKFVFLIPLKR